MAKNGLEPAIAVRLCRRCSLETVGGVCLVVGLFTRFFAAALAIEMLIALFVVHFAEGLCGRRRRI